MTFLLLLYLGLACLAGIGLTLFSELQWDLEGRVALGISLGCAAAAMLTWLAAAPFGMADGAVIAGAAGLAVIVCAALRWTPWRSTLAPDWQAAVARWRSRKVLPFAIVLTLALLFFIPFYGHALELQDDGLHPGYTGIWGDWTSHMGLTTYFSSAQHVLPPPSPWMAGTSLPYSFLPDFFSSILMHLGLGPWSAMPLSSALLSIALVVIFFSVAQRFIGSRWGALAATVIFFLGSGLGFALLGGDIQSIDGSPLGYLSGFFSAVLAPVREYTDLPDLGFQWRNPVLAMLVPQRSTDFGWAMGLFALAVLWHAWTTKSRREMIVVGVTVGLLPLFHETTYAGFIAFGGAVALLSLRSWRRWLWFFVPALVLGLPQMIMILPPAETRYPFIHFELGWMSSVYPDSYNPIWFWLINTFLLIPISLVGLFSSRFGIPRMRRFLLPTLAFFVVPNVLVLAPWNWDNSKFLIWWAMPASILMAAVLVKVGRVGRRAAAVAVLLVGLQSMSGGLDLIRAWHSDIQLPLHVLYTPDDLALATWARDNTDPQAVFLTAGRNDNPILAMSQRRVVLGWLSTAWSLDIDYRPRLADEVSMYRGDPSAGRLFERYGVNYVVVGPYELTDMQANLGYYHAGYSLVYFSPKAKYQVFAVR